MPRLEPLKRADVPEYEGMFAFIEQYMGFVPNSMLTMARNPKLMEAFAEVSRVVRMENSLDPHLANLVALIASTAAGCRYCQAHTANAASRMGGPVDKVENVWEFETSEHFDEAERAALRLARDAAQVPNGVTETHFVDLRRHFDDGQIVDLVALVSLYGFLNRWNDTFATQLEADPLAVADAHLAASGWSVGKHA